MQPSSRRSFLGKFFGAGSLLLPAGGSGALALTRDAAKIAETPVTLVGLPFSKEAIHLRAIRDHLHSIRGKRGGEWHALMTGDYARMSAAITSRAEPTWTDCVELAEDIWHSMAKVEALDADGCYLGTTGTLAKGDTRPEIDFCAAGVFHSRHAIAALVEAVLTLGNGERRDPRTIEGFHPRPSRHTSA